MKTFAVLVLDQESGTFLALHFVKAEKREDVPNIVLATYGYDKALTIIMTYDV